MYRRKVTKPQTTVLNPKRRPRNNNNNNKLTPKKPKTIARAELNKLTSLSRNQKINYLEKIKQNPNNILRILYNARRVAKSQRPASTIKTNHESSFLKIPKVPGFEKCGNYFVILLSIVASSTNMTVWCVMTSAFARLVFGEKSPYPTVLMVMSEK